MPAADFEVHVARSIPFYREGHDLLVDLADQLVPPGGRCYDLGCSTGVLTARLRDRLAGRGAEVIGVDREAGMIELALERHGGQPGIRFESAALEDLVLAPCDLAISYYTLQFVPASIRQRVVDGIRRALEPAGSLIMFEKTLSATARDQDTATAIYHRWKLRQGFSEEEVAAKARSLRGVLVAQTSAENERMLRRAGFGEVAQVFRWLLFEGLAARCAG